MLTERTKLGAGARNGGAVTSRIGAHRGHLVIDNRAAPSSPAAPGFMPGVGGGELFEADTYTCAHCQRIIIMHPQRTRPREVCFRCMAVVCDTAACQLDCLPFKKLFEEYNPKLLEGFAQARRPELWLPNSRKDNE